MGMSDKNEEPGFGVETTDDWVPELMEVVRRRAPRIADAGIRGGWAGLYEMTPDHNAVIGEAAGVSRFLYATGFSGHGFLQGPAVGEILRDMVLRHVRRRCAVERGALRRGRLASRVQHRLMAGDDLVHRGCERSRGRLDLRFLQ
jgi:glycine/D-amino acid oxidase-like deaminating enzyme